MNISLASAATVTLTWEPNSEPDLAGYKIYYRTSSSKYTELIDVGLAGTLDSPQYVISDLIEGTTYYFTLTAYDDFGNDSDFSNEVSIFIEPSTGGQDIQTGSNGGGCGRIDGLGPGGGHGLVQLAFNSLILAILLSLLKLLKVFMKKPFDHDVTRNMKKNTVNEVPDD